MNGASQAQAPENRPAPRGRAGIFRHTGNWQRRRIDLVTFNTTDEMIEFEVMTRPVKLLRGPGEQIGNRIGPQQAH